MPSLQFYAVNDDIRVLMDFFFENGYVVYESCSFNRGVKLFSSSEEVSKDYNMGSKNLFLSLYKSDFCGKIVMTQTKLNDGGYRTTPQGWGLMVLHLEKIFNGTLSPCYFAHNSKVRAEKWQDTYPEFGNYMDWDWDLLTNQSTSFKYHIRKLCTDKILNKLAMSCASSLYHDNAFAPSPN